VRTKQWSKSPDLGIGVAVDSVMAVAETLGLSVEFRDIGPASGFLYASGLVVLNIRHGAAAQRENLAHECGHAYWGHDWRGRHDISRDERIADRYAARLLVGVEGYARAERLVGPHPGALAKELGVTRRLIELRQEDFAGGRGRPVPSGLDLWER